MILIQINWQINKRHYEKTYFDAVSCFIHMEEWTLFYRWLSGLEIAPDWFADAMKSTVQSFDSVNYVVDTDL